MSRPTKQLSAAMEEYMLVLEQMDSMSGEPDAKFLSTLDKLIARADFLWDSFNDEEQELANKLCNAMTDKVYDDIGHKFSPEFSN